MGKNKKKKKNLKLEKETIRDLQNSAMNDIEGGTAPLSPLTAASASGGGAGSVALSSVALSASPVVSTLVASTGAISALSMSVYNTANSILSNNGACPPPPGRNTGMKTVAWSNCGCVVVNTNGCSVSCNTSCPV